MTKSDEKMGTVPQPPRPKGGGDGSAKNAEERGDPTKTGVGAGISDDAAESATRSRKITTSRG
jgi:hypothetical protein